MLIRTLIITALSALLAAPALARDITDALGRTITLPDQVDRVICSGSGCLRLLTYLQAQDLIVAVDDIETRRRSFDARPYALANPQFKKMPIFGEFRGHDNPELILSLDPQPQVIFKTYATMGHDPLELEKKTAIPVVVLDYGNLASGRDHLYQAISTMGKALGREQRASEVVAFFQKNLEDLERRTVDIPKQQRPAAYLGGVAFKGPHGFESTEPTYPPFALAGVRNLAGDDGTPGAQLEHSTVAKETIVSWDPELLFLDLSTLQMEGKAGGLHQLKTDPAYQTLTAVREGRIYGVLPYNLYTQNFGSILANAYFIGHLLYPDRFPDIEPSAKADEIYTFLLGKPIFSEMNAIFDNLAFTKIPVE